VKNKGVIAAEAPVATRLLTPVTMDLRRKLARKGVETGDVIGRQLRRFGWAEEELVFGDVALFPLGRLDLSIDPAVFNAFIGLLDTRRRAGEVAVLGAPQMRIVGVALSTFTVRTKRHSMLSHCSGFSIWACRL
jgi:hypothetical protein